MQKALFLIVLLSLTVSCKVNSDLFTYLPEQTQQQFKKEGKVTINQTAVHSFKIDSLLEDIKGGTKPKLLFFYDAICDDNDLSFLQSIDTLFNNPHFDFRLVFVTYYPLAFEKAITWYKKYNHSFSVLDNADFGGHTWKKLEKVVAFCKPITPLKKYDYVSSMFVCISKQGITEFFTRKRISQNDHFKHLENNN